GVALGERDYGQVVAKGQQLSVTPNSTAVACVEGREAVGPYKAQLLRIQSGEVLLDVQQSATSWANIKLFIERETAVAGRFDATLCGWFWWNSFDLVFSQERFLFIIFL